MRQYLPKMMLNPIIFLRRERLPLQNTLQVITQSSDSNQQISNYHFVHLYATYHLTFNLYYLKVSITTCRITQLKEAYLMKMKKR